MTKPFKFNDQDRSNLDGADELEIEPYFFMATTHESGRIESTLFMRRRWLDSASEKVRLGHIEMAVEDGVVTVRVYIRKGAKVALIANGVKVNG